MNPRMVHVRCGANFCIGGGFTVSISQGSLEHRESVVAFENYWDTELKPFNVGQGLPVTFGMVTDCERDGGQSSFK